MKRLRIFFLFLIISLLILCGSFQHVYFRTVSEELILLSEELSADVLLHDWSKARETLRSAESLWRRHRDILGTMITHELITNISVTLAELSADLAAENYPQLPSEAARLTEHIRVFSKTERICLSNIF